MGYAIYYPMSLSECSSYRGPSSEYLPPSGEWPPLQVPDLVITNDEDGTDATVSCGPPTPCRSPCGSPATSGYLPPLIFFTTLVMIWKNWTEQLAALLPIGGKEYGFDRSQSTAAIFSSNVFYLLLKPHPRTKGLPAINPQLFPGLSVQSEFVKHVAFYAWSPYDVSTTLAALAENCPRLETITIGFTHIEGLTTRQFQNLLWCGWDSVESGDDIKTLTPDLKAFAQVFENGLGEVRSLGAHVLPEAEEVLFPQGHEGLGQVHNVHPMDRHFHGPNPPVISVVEVPLLNSGSREDIEHALREGTKCDNNQSEEDSQVEESRNKENQLPPRPEDMNLPQIRTNTGDTMTRTGDISLLPLSAQQTTRPPPNLLALYQHMNRAEPAILADMPVRASFQPSGRNKENCCPMTYQQIQEKLAVIKEATSTLSIEFGRRSDLYSGFSGGGWP